VSRSKNKGWKQQGWPHLHFLHLSSSSHDGFPRYSVTFPRWSFFLPSTAASALDRCDIAPHRSYRWRYLCLPSKQGPEQPESFYLPNPNAPATRELLPSFAATTLPIEVVTAAAGSVFFRNVFSSIITWNFFLPPFTCETVSLQSVVAQPLLPPCRVPPRSPANLRSLFLLHQIYRAFCYFVLACGYYAHSDTSAT